MLKSMVIGMISLTTFFSGLLGGHTHDAKQPMKHIDVVNNGGLTVLKNGDQYDYQTIVGQVTSIGKQARVKDVYNNNISYQVSSKNLHKGEVVLVTMSDDGITKVTKNTMSVGDKVKGQVIAK